MPADTAPLTVAEADALLAVLGPYRGLVLAVSGGSDSIALMHLVAEWDRRHGRQRAGPDRRLLVVTVDHLLRPGSTEEARAVGIAAEALGLSHAIRSWSGPKPRSGLQAAARAIRYRFLAEAAVDLGLAEAAPLAIVTAHTADDQAETVLMRLQRGSGVEGLAGIPVIGNIPDASAVPGAAGIAVVRPLLSAPRARLRATLADRGVDFVEDPSNRDARFERVRARKALAVLETLGVTSTALVRTAARMQSARTALAGAADALEREAVRTTWGLVREIDLERLKAAPEEIACRVLRRSLQLMAGAALPADLTSIEATWRALSAGAPKRSRVTLGGCIVDVVRGRGGEGHRLRVYREPDRAGSIPVLRLQPGGSADWDGGRFQVRASVSASVNADVGPLGADWPRLRDRHPCLAALPVPARAARGMPAFRAEGRLLAVPVLARFARAAGATVAAEELAGPPDVLTGEAAFNAIVPADAVAAPIPR